MLKGAILTVGKSVESEVFFLRRIQPDYVAMICTNSSSASITEICREAGVDFANCGRFEVPDDAEEMDKFIRKCEEAYSWLKNKCGDVCDIWFNPTAGRKWMSAGLAMFAARTPWEVLYVNGDYEGTKLKPGSERLVRLGSVEDFASFSGYDQAAALFNRLDFVGAHETFSALEPIGSAAARELYQGLAEISRSLARWERFEHYACAELIEGLDRGGIKVMRAAIELDKDLSMFVDETKAVQVHVKQVSQGPRPSLEAVTDLYFNACRRIEVGRLDDGVARLYRTLEACAQWLLSMRGLNTAKIDWHLVDEHEQLRFRRAARLVNGDLPTELGLVNAFRLVSCLDASVEVAPEGLLTAFRHRHGIGAGAPLEGVPLVALVTQKRDFAVGWEGVPHEVRTQYEDDGRPPPTELPLFEALEIDPGGVLKALRSMFVNQQGNFVFEKHLRLRNESILAHGWTPVERARTEGFQEAVRELLQELGADLEGWQVPRLPPLWS